VSPVAPARAARAVVWFAALAPAFAQEQAPTTEATVALTVTAVGDRSVYLDHGRDVGLKPGVFVRLFPPGAGEIEVEVRVVSQTSARADVPIGLAVPPVGTRGEARVVRPTGDGKPAIGQGQGQGDKPAHPGWARREPPRAAGQPLLVPTYGQRPEERDATLDGRLFASYLWNRDRGGDSDSDYSLLRTGVRADATNWLGGAERVRVAAEFDERRAAVADRPDAVDQTGRIDLGSVAFGSEGYAPYGVEVGRFFSVHLPEIGLVDGVEGVLRYQGGLRVGGGTGAYPRPFPARDAGDDVGVHGFVDWTADDRRTVAAALGVQKTWHRGDADRDLLLARGEWRPWERVALLGSAKVDWYDGDDWDADPATGRPADPKGQGFELTEAMLQARVDAGDFGFGAMATRFTWPALRRVEYQMLPIELVTDGYVERIGVNGSWRASAAVALRARVDQWRDQDRDGATIGSDVDWRGAWSPTAAATVSMFVNDGGYAAGPGARLLLRERLGDIGLRAGYRWYRYELGDLATGPEDFVRQSVELGAGCPIAADGDLDLTFERWFGDREDAFALALYLQWRF
jgi:hypothetical protein